MPGNTCLVCHRTRCKDSSITFHRFPSDPVRLEQWLVGLQLNKVQVKAHSLVCSRHFPGGDVKLNPDLTLGKRFSSPKKKWSSRAKRARARDATKRAAIDESSSGESSRSRSTTPILSPKASTPKIPTTDSTPPLFSAAIGEQLDTDYEVYELPSRESSDSDDIQSQSTSSAALLPSQSSEVIVNTALLARVEALEAENKQLMKRINTPTEHFRLEHIQHDDKLVRFYTGFMSFMILQSFFDFLGPVVNELRYWGTKEGRRLRRRSQKLDPINQFFLLLIKLRLNLRNKDLAYRFGISTSAVSRYITTWVCFLYHHLSELEWMPSVDQVSGTLPHAFKEKYPATYAIIDGSEIFLETPSDLHMQSSTWSQYKHHNTAKFLVACTPNGAVAYMSPLYVGSISDIELTRVSGFLSKLEDKAGVSIMADRGFTIKALLSEMKVDLNMPPFLEGRQQLSSDEVERGRKIASLRIHVERCIGRIKNFGILKGTIPISMARLSNQIVCICGYLSNFQPALVPVPNSDPLDSTVEDYFEGLQSDSEEGYTAGSEDDN